MKPRRTGACLSEICSVTVNVLFAALFAMLMMTPSQPAWSEEMRGLLVMGHETRSLQLCGDDRTLWVSVPSAVRQQLEASVRHVTTRPYEAVYVELNGELSVEPASEFGADYDGTVEAHQVRFVTKEGIDACRSERWKAKSEVAVGGEPSTYVFVCNDDRVYTVRATGAEAWVFRPEGTHRLSAVPAEKGARYADGVFELDKRDSRRSSVRQAARASHVATIRIVRCGKRPSSMALTFGRWGTSRDGAWRR